MTPTNEYAIIYLLPEPARSYHLDLWARVASAFKLTDRPRPKAPPHLTLKYSFVTDELELIEQTLADYCASTAPTPWSLHGFNAFGNSVIFLEVVPSPAARAAHAALLERLRPIPGLRWDQYDNADLHFHATIAYRGLTAANFADVLAFVRAQPPPDFDLYFDNLTLLKINSDIDTIRRTFHLTGATSLAAGC